jgi:hypothetical protein
VRHFHLIVALAMLAPALAFAQTFAQTEMRSAWRARG